MSAVGSEPDLRRDERQCARSADSGHSRGHDRAAQIDPTDLDDSAFGRSASPEGGRSGEFGPSSVAQSLLHNPDSAFAASLRTLRCRITRPSLATGKDTELAANVAAARLAEGVPDEEDAQMKMVHPR
jgi:hypothetical protein